VPGAGELAEPDSAAGRVAPARLPRLADPATLPQPAIVMHVIAATASSVRGQALQHDGRIARLPAGFCRAIRSGARCRLDAG
jgi:hypothetical protein